MYGKQEQMVLELSHLSDELKVRSTIEAQNRIFDKIEVNLEDDNNQNLHLFLL